MKEQRRRFPFFILNILAISGVLLSSGCEYEYTSPLPGTIDVKLRVISNDIAFDPLNNFVLYVTEVYAVRADDNAKAYIYEDTKAIDRTTSIYNTLDIRARDSAIVMGEANLPPASYASVNLLITPGNKVVLDGYRNIDVFVLDTFSPLLVFRTPYSIEELKTKNIVVTIDLDQSLIKLSNAYLFVPVYYISSIN